MNHKLKRAFVIVLGASVISTASGKKTADEISQQITSSDIVAVGDLSINELKGTNSYVSLKFTTQKLLKSSVIEKKVLNVLFYDRKKGHKKSIEYLKLMTSKPVLVFLVQVDDSSDNKLYLAGSLKEAIRVNSQALQDAVDRELILHQKIIEEYKPNKKLPHYAKVKNTLSSIKDSKSQRKAFSDLLALSNEAVPAIIAHMDDFRELPESRISLANSKRSFEAFRHYSPDKVVDALAAILNQITGSNFRSIHNGGTARERRETINAWRIYDYKTRRMKK